MNKKLAFSILAFGSLGAFINFFSFINQETQLFLISQLLGAVTAMMYDRFLIGKFTVSSVISSFVTTCAVVLNNEWVIYLSMGCRSINYQIVFFTFCKKNRVF